MEYFLHWWGGCEEKVKEEYGYENYLYFSTKEERDRVEHNLRKFNHLGLALDKQESDKFVHKDTIAIVTLRYKNREYCYEHNFGREYPEDSVRFMYEDGNYSCDCNRSLFLSDDNRDYIKRHFCEDFEEMGCGEEIELVSLEVAYR